MKYGLVKLEWQRKRTALLKEKYRRRNPGAVPLRAVAIFPKKKRAA